MPGRLGPASRLPITYIVVSWPYNPLRSTALIIKAHPFGRPSSRITRLVTATSMQPSSAAFIIMLVLPSRITGHGGHGLLVPPSRVIKAHPFGRPSGSRRAEGRRKLIPNRFGWPPTATNARRFTVTPSAEGSEAVDQLRSPPATPNVRPFRVLLSAEGGEAVDQLRSPPAAPSVSWISNLSELLVPPSEVVGLQLPKGLSWFPPAGL